MTGEDWGLLALVGFGGAGFGAGVVDRYRGTLHRSLVARYRKANEPRRERSVWHSTGGGGWSAGQALR